MLTASNCQATNSRKSAIMPTDGRYIARSQEAVRFKSISHRRDAELVNVNAPAALLT